MIALARTIARSTALASSALSLVATVLGATPAHRLVAPTSVSAIATSTNEPAPIEDFTLVQISDTHVEVRLAGAAPAEHLRGEETFRWMSSALAGPQTIGGVTVPAPSFVVATGDLTEFGAVGDTWKDVERLFALLPCPWWPVAGNHDRTWHPIDEPYLQLLAQRETQSSARLERVARLNRHDLSYSFDAHGCHFLALNSATRQEPLPSFDTETLTWIKNDAVTTGPRVPVFVFLHHPPDSDEFAQPVTQRLLFDALDGANVVLMLYGHGHVVDHRRVFGVDCVQGGTTFTSKGVDARGCNVVSVRDGVLRVAYRYLDDAKPMQVLLEKPVASLAPVGAFSFRPRDEVNLAAMARRSESGRHYPDFHTGVMVEHARMDATWGALDEAAELRLFLDDAPLPLVYATPSWELPSSRFVDEPSRRWELGLPSSAYTPGAHLLSAELHSDCAPTRTAARVFDVWNRDVRESKYPKPTATLPGKLLEDDAYYHGDEHGTMHGVTGWGQGREWTYSTGGYAIESLPAVAGDLLVFGAWDGNVHALHKHTGELAWKVPGPTSSRSGGAARYYAPADVSPVVIGERIFVCDRGYALAWYSLAGERHDMPFENVAAIAASEDGRRLYLRGKDDRLTCIDGDGAIVWRTNVDLGRNPVPPVARDGFVYVCSDRGLVSWVRASDGRVMTQWQATPGSYVFEPLVVRDDGEVCVTDSLRGPRCLERLVDGYPAPRGPATSDAR